MVAETALFVGLLAVLYLVATTVPLARRVRRLKKIVRIEKTRTHWAEARDLLYTMVREGKLSSDSATFHTFCQIHTFVLRRPEEYDEISRTMASTFLAPPAAGLDNSWLAERDSWPEEMREVMNKMVAGTGALLFGHAGLRRLVVFGLKISPWLAMRIGKGAVRRIYRTAGKIPAIRTEKTFLDVQRKMQEQLQYV